MTVKYYAILTNQGAARLANATMLGSKLNLTQMAVGDANGVLPTPDPAQTKLINQKRIAPLNLLSVDPNNQSQIIAEQIIPENEGGFWIREIGLYDDEGVLIAVANCPETYKPQLQEGSGRTQTIRMILVVTNTEAITLKIDPSVVLATRKYVDDKALELIDGAPATLNTLEKIAKAINNDQEFGVNINNALAGKQPLDETLTNLSGKDVAGLLSYLGLGEGSALPVGVPVPWPSATPPAGWLKCNGAAFSSEMYPNLAKAYPTNKLPDLRGEFIRGWDDGRGIDSGRSLLNAQSHSVIDHIHYMELWTGEGLAANSTRAGTNPGILATYGDGGIVKTDESGVKVPSSLRAIGTRGVYRLGANGGNTGTENRPRNIAFNYIVRAT